MALFGACFLKKTFVFHYTGISKLFWTPFYEKISFSFLRRFAGRFGEVFLEKVLLFTIRRFQRRFGTPFCKKHPFRIYGEKEWVL